jgi:hypothetical protein
MLINFHGLSSEKIEVILKRFPTLESLYALYLDPKLSETVKKGVLEFAGGTQKATKLSERMYTFFTTADGSTVLN